jgi:large subunit ribosomal protein L24
MAGLNSKLKAGDEVIVIAGKAKGQSGKIARVITANNRVIISGINLAKVHVSARKAMAKQQEPGIVSKELSIAASNVMLKDAKTGKPTRLGYRLEADGSKVRVAKKSNTVVDTIKKAKATKAKAQPAKAPKAKATKTTSK